MPPIALFGYVRYLQRHDQQATRYQQEIWAKLSIPFSIVAMIMMSAPFVFGRVRCSVDKVDSLEPECCRRGANPILGCRLWRRKRAALACGSLISSVVLVRQSYRLHAEPCHHPRAHIHQYVRYQSD